jgi:hypothetical protein
VKRAAIFLASLGMIACSSSSDPNQPKLTLEVTEILYGGRGVPFLGPHDYQVLVTNHSQFPIVVDSIRLDPGFGGGLEIIDGSQDFADEVPAAMTMPFNMQVTLQAARDRNGPDANYKLDSLRVELGYHTEGGATHIESCTCFIRRVKEGS